MQEMDPRVMQINLTGFLNAKRAREFVAELWDMLVEAQKTEDGIPPKLIAEKMEQLKNKVVSFLVFAKLTPACLQEGSYSFETSVIHHS